jgi:hypothetical protein
MAALAVLALAALPATASAAYSFPSEAANVSDGLRASPAVDCGAGEKLVSGGVETPAVYANGVYLSSTYPFQGVWGVGVDNYDFAADPISDPITVTAACDDSAKARYAYRSKDPVTVFDGDERAVKVACREDEVAVGGGANSVGLFADEIYMSASIPYDGRDRKRKLDDGWRVEFNNDEGGSAGVAVTPIAVCDRRRSVKAYAWGVSVPASIADGNEAKLGALCPGDSKVISGGAKTVGEYEHGLYLGTNSFAPGEEGWISSMVNYDSPDDGHRGFVVRAICRK